MSRLGGPSILLFEPSGLVPLKHLPVLQLSPVRAQIPPAPHKNPGFVLAVIQTSFESLGRGSPFRRLESEPDCYFFGCHTLISQYQEKITDPA